jgi:AraC-like DNA-binding protein
MGDARAPRWLHFPLAVVFTAWLLGLLRTLQCISHAPRELDLVFAFAEVGVTVAAIYLVVRHGGNGADATETAPAKYARSKLDPATIARIKGKLERALARPDVYGDSLLNLRSLSRTIGEKAHYVSQVINQDLDATFYELVSRYRIEQAKKLLAHAPEQTVLEIALAVGFNAKSTFNTAFRRYAGMTPTEFRAKAI